MRFLQAIWDIIIQALSVRPSYDVDPKTLPMNQDPIEPIEQPVETPLSPAERLHFKARDWVGNDPSPLDPVDDNIACVDALTTVIQGVYPDFPKLYHTAELARELKKNVHFA